MKNSFKHLLVAILVLAAVVLPVIGSANSYKATETTESTEVEIGTQGVLTAANMYDWNFGCYNDIIVFMSYDDTQTLSTLTGQTEGDSFAWFYNFMLEYNAEKGVWVVTKADMDPSDNNSLYYGETLGTGKMIVMFHDQLANGDKESYEFYKANVKEGAEFYLSVDPSYIYDAYDYLDDAFLSTVPVEVKAPETEADTTTDTTVDTTTEDNADADKEGGVNPILIVAIVVVVIAIVGIIVVVSKRKKTN
jgi:hypothetical protein